MMKKILNLRWLILAGIILLALVLRINKVSTIPSSLSWDEVSIGYNAYSILKIGRDEHQRFLPLDTFAGYGDYKPPLPIYLTIPMIAVFGLSEFSVRLPSVIAGTLAVWFTYYLVSGLVQLPIVALLASLLLAISPWHIQLSRAGFEANIATFLIILGTSLVLFIKKRPKLLLVCWIPFVAAVYTFNSARYFGPLLMLALLIFQRREILKYKKYFILGMILSLLLLLPILPHLLSKEARLRFAEVNIFTDGSIVEIANQRMDIDKNVWWSKILHNRRVGFARSYLTHFLDHFQPKFLFISGDGNPKFSLQDVGQLYLIEAPFLIFGLLWLWKKNRSAASLLLFWVLAAIVPAATARETPHALRIENTLPTWQVFIAVGIWSVIERFQSQKTKLFFGIILTSLYIMSFFYFMHNYYNHYAREFSGEWQYGYREAIRFIETQKNNYDQIVMSESIGRPYMYVLFYEKYDPHQLASNIKSSFDEVGFYNVTGLGKYTFIRGGIGEMHPKTLYILSPQFVPNNARVLKTINLLNGNPVLVIFTQS